MQLCHDEKKGKGSKIPVQIFVSIVGLLSELGHSGIKCLLFVRVHGLSLVLLICMQSWLITIFSI